MKNKKKYYIVGGLFVSLVTVYTIYHIMEGVVANDHKNKTHYSSGISGPAIDSSDGAGSSSKFYDKKEIYFEGLTLEAKIEKEKELNKLAVKGMTVISGLTIYNALVEKGVVLDADMAERMKNDTMTAKDLEMLNIYIAELLTEEENFKVELRQYRDFHQMKSAFDRRTAATGLFYGTELLNEPAAYKGMKFDDVRQLLDAGAVLPENVMSNIVRSGNIDLAVQLHEAGVNINPNYVDKYRSMNVIEVVAESYAINPYSPSVEDQINKFQKLNDLGVAMKVTDGTRDALDIVLNGAFHHESKEAENLLVLAQHLNRMGVSVEKSHIQLLEKIRSKHPDLYSEYAQVLR